MNFLIELCDNADFLTILLVIKNIIKLFCIIAPIILLVMLGIDFSKNVISNSEDEMKRNVNTAIKRIIYCIAVFLAPTIVGFTLNLLSNTVFTSIKNCTLNANSEHIATIREQEEAIEDQQQTTPSSTTSTTPSSTTSTTPSTSTSTTPSTSTSSTTSTSSNTNRPTSIKHHGNLTCNIKIDDAMLKRCNEIQEFSIQKTNSTVSVTCPYSVIINLQKSEEKICTAKDGTHWYWDANNEKYKNFDRLYSGGSDSGFDEYQPYGVYPYIIYSPTDKKVTCNGKKYTVWAAKIPGESATTRIFWVEETNGHEGHYEEYKEGQSSC